MKTENASEKLAASERVAAATLCSDSDSDIRKNAVGATVLDVWAAIKKNDLNYFQAIQTMALMLHQIKKKTGEDPMPYVAKMWSQLTCPNSD